MCDTYTRTHTHKHIHISSLRMYIFSSVLSPLNLSTMDSTPIGQTQFLAVKTRQVTTEQFMYQQKLKNMCSNHL